MTLIELIHADHAKNLKAKSASQVLFPECSEVMENF